MAQGLEPRRFRFGTFDFDPDSGELRKNGTRIPLAKQPADLLAILLSRPGALFTREELRQRLWPGGTFVDFDHGLNVAVTKIRVALGDSASSPRYIETIPRRGYRFVADVEGSLDLSAADAGAEVAGHIETSAGERAGDAEAMTVEANEPLPANAPPEDQSGAARPRTTSLHPRRIGVAVLVCALLAAGWLGVERMRQPQAVGWSSAEAHEAWLRGRYLLRSASEHDCRASIGYFERALELQPSSAAAHAGLADGYGAMALLGLMPSSEAVPRARVAARRALELDGSLAEAHASLARVALYFDWDPEAAGQRFRTALQLGRTRPEILLAYSRFLALVGRFDEASAAAREAAAIDPLSPDGPLAVAWSEYQAGRHDQALSTLRILLQGDPSFAAAHMQVAWNHAHKGECPLAVEAARRALTLVPVLCEDQLLLPTLAWVFGTCGERVEAERLRDRLAELAGRRWVDPTALAVAYAGLGETDEAFRLLERGLDVRSPSVVYLRADPIYKDLRTDPRFQEVERCAGLQAPAWEAANAAADFVPRAGTRP